MSEKLTQPEAEPAPPAMPTKEQITAWQEKRSIEFLERINALAEELDMAMVAVPVFTADGRVTAQIRVQPR